MPGKFSLGCREVWNILHAEKCSSSKERERKVEDELKGTQSHILLCPISQKKSLNSELLIKRLPT